jgi:hypothetical protein
MVSTICHEGKITSIKANLNFKVMNEVYSNFNKNANIHRFILLWGIW